MGLKIRFKEWCIFIIRGILGIVLIPIWLILVLFILMNMLYKNVVGVFTPDSLIEAQNTNNNETH